MLPAFSFVVQQYIIFKSHSACVVTEILCCTDTDIDTWTRHADTQKGLKDIHEMCVRHECSTRHDFTMGTFMLHSLDPICGTSN